MKKQFKTRLVLNSQTIRSLQTNGLKEVQGGIPVNNSEEVCVGPSYNAACSYVNCTLVCNGGGGRACG